MRCIACDVELTDSEDAQKLNTGERRGLCTHCSVGLFDVPDVFGSVATLGSDEEIELVFGDIEGDKSSDETTDD